MDPALDHEHSQMALYLTTGDWDQFVKLKPGTTATVFHVRRLSRAQTTAVKMLPEAQQPSALVAYGVESVDNFALANGQKLVCKTTGEGEDKRLDGDTLNGMYAEKLFEELATIIRLVGHLDPLDVPASASSPG